ncbi:hypothetical protein F4859DRAFT_518689 [Xylaria cf. heliscus]|nr:hypothetical protein F4859DRAFT_518689 [Xylaria cf. heliscus]
MSFLSGSYKIPIAFSTLFSRSCKRSFNSESALTQHRVDKQKGLIRFGCLTFSAPKSKKAKPAGAPWILKGAQSFDPFHIFSETTLTPCDAAVSSETASEFICSYNWQDSKEAKIKIPGFAPMWQPVPLPIKLPADKGVHFIDQCAARVPKYPFEAAFRAAEVMNSTINFSDVDIVVNRNSLRKLLNFCAGVIRCTFRLNLSMINNTLFIERCEKNARGFIRGQQEKGWGYSFEQRFTKLPKGLERSIQYHRVIRYPLGPLSCVVRFEVDACYQEGNEGHERIADDHTDGSLALDIGQLSIKANSEQKKAVLEQTPKAENEFIPMPQSTTAEIKTGRRNQSPSRSLPQLWFGRTPWLIRGSHVEGTFHNIDITNVEAKFLTWETNYQDDLRRMVSLLSQLRETVSNSGFKRCIATCEKPIRPLELKIFAATREDEALPKDLIGKFWREKSDEVAGKVAGGEGK